MQALIVVLIISANGFEDTELLVPMYRLKEAGIEVHVASIAAGRITGKNGHTVRANLAFEDVDSKQYAALIIPGGKAPETVRLNESAVRIVQEMMDAGKPVAAICHGIQVLISAERVRGKKATCYKGVRDDLKAAGGNYVDEEVVVDGNLITSRIPNDLPAFCRELMKAISK